MIELILLLTVLWSATEIEPTAQPVTAPQMAAAPVAQDYPEPPSRDAAPAEDISATPSLPLRRAAESIPAPEAQPAIAANPAIGGLHLVRSDKHYASDGRQVRLEVLRQDSDQRRPAILILHGASGIGDGAFYHSAAEIFADRGYITFLPHYLAAISSQPTAPADKTAKNKKPAAAPKSDSSVKAGFSLQEKILSDALDAIAQNPYVDASRIGVFGLSLGGFHALNLSSRDYRIGAVVDMAGALRGNTMPESNRIAPTLALHGAKDKTIPVSRARSLAAYLKNHGIAHELVVYPDQGHFFRGKAQQDALQRSASFFGDYLNAAPYTSRAVRSGPVNEPPR